MKCACCPLFESWNNENGSGASCGIFGDDWGNRFQYEDKEGTITGCYIDHRFIKKAEIAYEQELERRVQYFIEQEAEKQYDYDRLLS